MIADKNISTLESDSCIPAKRRKIEISNDLIITPELSDEIALEWYCQLEKKFNNPQYWASFVKLLKREKSIDWSSGTCTIVLQALVTHLRASENGSIKDNILLCLETILFNKGMKEYFSVNLKKYFNIFSNILRHESIDNAEKILLDYPRTIGRFSFCDKFRDYFLKYVYDHLITICTISNSRRIHETVFSIFSKFFVFPNARQFFNFISYAQHKANDFKRVKLVYNFVQRLSDYSYNDEKKLEVAISMFLRALIRNRRKNENFISLGLKYSILFLQLAGLDLNALFGFSFHIDVEMNNLLKIKILKYIMALLDPKVLDLVIYEVKLLNFLEDVIMSYVITSYSPENIALLLLQVFRLNPEIIERNIETILFFVFFINKLKKSSNLLMQKIVNHYKKTFRVYEFIYRFTNVVHNCSENRRPGGETKVTFERSSKKTKDIITIENIFSKELNSSFIMMFSLLPFNSLNECTVENIQTLATILTKPKKLFKESNNKSLYLETICKLISLQIQCYKAEGTIDQLNKTAATINILKEILRDFGSCLLNAKHNPEITRAFFELCYYCSQFCNLMAYYCKSFALKALTESSDLIECDLTCLHDYLTADQWSSLAQRVTNFGDDSCKSLMFLLYLQVIKTHVLFNATVKEDAYQFVAKYAVTHLDLLFSILLSDKFILHEILPKFSLMDRLEVSAKIVDYAMLTENTNFLRDSFILDSCLIGPIVYMYLQYVQRVFKKSLTNELFDAMNSCNFMESESEEKLQELLESFKSIYVKTIIPKLLSKESVRSYIQTLRNVPFYGLPSNYQTIFLLFIITLKRDFILTDLNDEANELDILLQDIICIANTRVLATCGHEIIFNINLDYENDEFCHSLFSKLISNNFENTVKNVSNYFAERLNSKISLMLLIKFLLFLDDKEKRLKRIEELPKCVSKINKRIFKLLRSQEKPNSAIILLLVLIAKLHIKFNIEKHKSDAIEYLKQWIFNAKMNSSGKNMFLILNYILSIKDHLEFDEKAVDDILQRISFKNLEVSDKFVPVLNLALENISEDCFSLFFNNVIHFANSTETLSQIWKNVFNAKLTKQKAQVLILELESFLLKYYYQERNVNYEVHLDMCVSIVSNPNVVISHFVMSNIFQSCTDALYDVSDSPRLEMFSHVLQVLKKMYIFRKDTVVKHLPVYFQIYRLLVRTLYDLSLTKFIAPDNRKKLSECALEINKITNLFKTSRPTIAKIAPHLVADFLSLYESEAVIPEVKIYLDDCIMLFIDWCDERTITYLMRILSPSSQEIFKVLNEQCKKNFKFRGAV